MRLRCCIYDGTQHLFIQCTIMQRKTSEFWPEVSLRIDVFSESKFSANQSLRHPKYSSPCHTAFCARSILRLPMPTSTRVICEQRSRSKPIAFSHTDSSDAAAPARLSKRVFYMSCGISISAVLRPYNSQGFYITSLLSPNCILTFQATLNSCLLL